MIFAIRVDDVGWNAVPSSPAPRKKPDAKLSLARGFHDALGGLPWLAAVIPSELDDAGREWIRSKPEGLEVALHGLDHRRVDGVSSEFLGLDYAGMKARLRKALDLLGVPTKHTVPPFNAIELGFEAACADLGITTVWGGLVESPALPTYTGWGRYVPAWSRLYGATERRVSPDTPVLLDELPSLLELGGYAVITLHVPWEAARDPEFRGVRKMANLVRGLVISPEEYASLGNMS